MIHDSQLSIEILLLFSQAISHLEAVHHAQHGYGSHRLMECQRKWDRRPHGSKPSDNLHLRLALAQLPQPLSLTDRDEATDLDRCASPQSKHRSGSQWQ
jgi:hypothetical protein